MSLSEATLKSYYLKRQKKIPNIQPKEMEAFASGKGWPAELLFFLTSITELPASLSHM
jgi:hypothetical protein